MSLYEYSRWDGSQNFLPQSADKLFDQLSEYLLQYGENILRNLEDLDDDDLPEVVALIEKDGLIERDKEGKWQVTPKGIRRIQDKALADLFQTIRRDGWAGTIPNRRAKDRSSSKTRGRTSMATRWPT